MSRPTEPAPAGLRRHHLLAAAAAGALAGCDHSAQTLPGGYTGMAIDRGHALRERLAGGAS